MERLFAFSIAIALSWGLLSLNPTRASADSSLAAEQCFPVVITRANWTLSHFHAKNSLIRKTMNLSTLVEKAGALSGLSGDANWYRKLRIGQVICLPHFQLPTYIQLLNPATDPSSVFTKLDGTRKRLHVVVDKDHLYDLNPALVRAYHEFTLQRGGVERLYRTNALIRERRTKRKFYETLSKLNNLTRKQLRNLKSGAIIKIPAVPPYIYAPDGRPINSLVAIATGSSVYRLEPKRAATEIKSFATAELPRLPNAGPEETLRILQNNSSAIRDLKESSDKLYEEIRVMIAKWDLFMDSSPRGVLDGVPDALYRFLKVIDNSLKVHTGIGLFWWVVAAIFAYVIYRIFRPRRRVVAVVP